MLSEQMPRSVSKLDAVRSRPSQIAVIEARASAQARRTGKSLPWVALPPVTRVLMPRISSR